MSKVPIFGERSSASTFPVFAVNNTYSNEALTILFLRAPLKVNPATNLVCFVVMCAVPRASRFSLSNI